jgi:hypothetical protein
MTAAGVHSSPALRRRARRQEHRHAGRAPEGSAVPSFEAAVPDAIITRLSGLLRYLDLW